MSSVLGVAECRAFHEPVMNMVVDLSASKQSDLCEFIKLVSFCEALIGVAKEITELCFVVVFRPND